tara:strand:- start:1078 stop:1755 length:678 start_codon:yes stop_codon:yes gene_type:complete
MSNILIIGANRGLGLEFARQYSELGHHIFATTRNKSKSDQLVAIANTTVLELDLNEDKSIDRFIDEMSSIKIDILIHNSGIFRDEQLNEDLEIDAWMNEMRINAITPIIVARKLKQNMLEGEDKKIIFISSQMGSIDDNYSGRFYFYRSSKSALNSAAKSLAIDWKDKDISVLMLHPGWVKTDMGGESAKLEIPDSIQHMIQVINDLNLETSGSFVNYEGNKLEW